MTVKCLWHQDVILAGLRDGATVVTASNRLARAVELAFAEAQLETGLRAWERPKVLSWTAFLSELLTAHEDATPENTPAGAFPRLLSPVQAETLWEQAVRHSGATDGLLQPLAAAQAAQEAWTLCHQYQLDPLSFAGSGHADAEQFAAWAASYREGCRAEHWLDAARLPDQLMAWIGGGQLPWPARILFAGFDEWTPQQQRFLQSLQQAGCVIQPLAFDAAEPTSAQRIACVDADQEMRRAASWAAALLQRDPGTRIGIVVRDLSACRERLRRAFDEYLCPSARLGAQPTRPYNFSLGTAQAEIAVIHDALLMLRTVTQSTAEFGTLSQLLRSPFLRGAQAECSARARLELQLREGGERFPISRLLELARVQGEVPELVTALTAALDWKRHQRDRQLPSAWARGFAELLRLLGWPGERTRDSAEHQAVEAFRELLGELARLDALTGLADRNECVARLSRLAAQSVFQPAGEDVPVQVMGELEAAGLYFDHLWIAGWSDDVWPASPRPNPLIPVSVQRQHNMPHASARRELEFAQQVTARLLASAPEVVVSVPQRDADQELRASPLIAGLPEVEPAQIPQRDTTEMAHFLQAGAPQMETLDDSHGPTLPEAVVHGGTGILKAQAACAFQAFARYRLGARLLEAPGPGLDPRERGQLLHDVLYRLYGELPDHRALTGLSEPQLESLMRHSVDAALARVKAMQPEMLTPNFLALERERLLRLLRDWLVVERARPPFEVVDRERDRQINIGPLTLSTRVDRVDRLVGGDYAIIDYKTGDAKPSDWQGERPDEPQLPCYAVTAADTVAAVLFGVLRPGETGYRGYARDAQAIPGISGFTELKHAPDNCGDWQALLVHWRSVLTRLAEDYAAGDARVAPKDRNRTCEVCRLQALCRIHEVGAPDEGDADE